MKHWNIPYLVYGAALCAALAYCNMVGWNVIDFDTATASKPTGPGQHYYHK